MATLRTRINHVPVMCIDGRWYQEGEMPNHVRTGSGVFVGATGLPVTHAANLQVMTDHITCWAPVTMGDFVKTVALDGDDVHGPDEDLRGFCGICHDPDIPLVQVEVASGVLKTEDGNHSFSEVETKIVAHNYPGSNVRCPASEVEKPDA